MSKQNPYQFNIWFNPNNPIERQAAEYLNQFQRTKAQEIAKAIDFYINNNAISNSNLSNSFISQDTDTKAMIKNNLSKFF